MMFVRIAGAAALSIVLAGPAAAYDNYGTQGAYTRAFRGYHDMRAQDALHFGRRISIRDITPVGAASMATAITRARSMTTWVRPIWVVGELS